MKKQLAPPKNWQDFEDLCHKLWRAIWGDIDTQKNGRQGQSQNGVDIFGIPPQCDDIWSHLTAVRPTKKVTKLPKNRYPTCVECA